MKTYLRTLGLAAMAWGCLPFFTGGQVYGKTMTESEKFEVDGICYRLIPGQTGCVEVVANPETSYSGNLIIPENVVHAGSTYQVTAVGDYAFTGSDVKYVMLHNGVQRIGQAAFSGCPSFRKVLVSDNMSTVADVGKVEDAVSMKYMSLPEQLTEIGDSAFYKSTVERIKIPGCVKKIGQGAFAECEKLQAVYCLSAVPAQCEKGAFDVADYPKVILLVPAGKVEQYRQASGWKTFSVINEYNQEYFLTGKDPREVTF